MSNSNKSLADRIAVMQAHCSKNRQDLVFVFGDTNTWGVIIDDHHQVGEPSEDFEEALGSAEAELYLTDEDEL